MNSTLKVKLKETGQWHDIKEVAHITRCRHTTIWDAYEKNAGKLKDFEVLAWCKEKIPVKKGRLSKPVQCIETGQQYFSIKDASECTGISRSSITKCCQEINFKAGGLHWKYIEFKENSSLSPLVVKPYGKKWGVFYNDILLKIFPVKEHAEIYASDSAEKDIEELEGKDKSSSQQKKFRGTRKTRAVCHLETGMVYPSISEAGRVLNIPHSSIYRAACGKASHAYGQHFEYAD